MAIKLVHVRVCGRVQGVFFRASTQDEAQKLCLSGWVRNMPDGSVETEIQGDELEVDRMVSWLHRGPQHSVVSEVVVTQKEPTEQYSGFKIRY